MFSILIYYNGKAEFLAAIIPLLILQKSIPSFHIVKRSFRKHFHMHFLLSMLETAMLLSIFVETVIYFYPPPPIIKPQTF